MKYSPTRGREHPQARAIRRAGELYNQIEPGKTGPKPELQDGAVLKLTRTQAAADAGLSERQRKMAERIQARAIRRCGELLKQIEPGQGARDGKRHEGALMPLNRTEAANQAGISERQRKMAERIQARAIRRYGELLKQIEPDKGGRPLKTYDATDIGLSRSQAARDAGLSERQRKMAERIQARAIRRYGELLKQIEPGQGARDGKRHEGDLMPLNRTEAATQAGISEWQKVTALRIANIPIPDFESVVESDSPRSPPVMLASKVHPTRAGGAPPRLSSPAAPSPAGRSSPGSWRRPWPQGKNSRLFPLS